MEHRSAEPMAGEWAACLENQLADQKAGATVVH